MKKNTITKPGRGKTPWDRAYKKEVLYRIGGDGGNYTLDRGVNYFVLKLESLGCKTLWSCEGHPDDENFYLIFISEFELATKIARSFEFSNFDVMICNSIINIKEFIDKGSKPKYWDNSWVIRSNFCGENVRIHALRGLSKTWEKML